MDIEEMLDEEIINKFHEFRECEDNEERSDKFSELVKLLEIKLTGDKIRLENQAKVDATTEAATTADKDRRAQQRNAIIAAIIQALGIAVPTVTSAFVMMKVLRFEETGIISTSTGKNLYQTFFKRR